MVRLGKVLHIPSFSLSLNTQLYIIYLALIVHLRVFFSSVFGLMQTGRAIASALNVAQTAHSYGDFMLLAKAAESKQVAYYFQSPLKYVELLVWS